jgi:23S rRNA pseudouridine1911/1915/1917 synthase
MTSPQSGDEVHHVVPTDSFLQRLDTYLTGTLPDVSRAKVQRLIEEGRVLLNGKKVKASLRVSPGDTIDVSFPPPELLDLKAEPIPLKLIHEDRWLAVIDKPAGLVVHPAPGHPSGTLVNALLHHMKKLSGVAGPYKPGIIHRLDKDTSGLLLVAKDDVTHRAVSRQFADRSVRRVYQAIVKGVMQQEQGTIAAPIGRDPHRRQRMTVRFGAGREAETRYKVLKRFKAATYVELYPQTGRTHQLRVHLAYVGHPLLGDQRYGVHGGVDRQALHAHRLGFLHPGTGKPVDYVSPFPKDLSQVLKQLPH